MPSKRLGALCLALVAMVVLVPGSYADHCECAQCGCPSRCRKVCRLVCEEKKVEITCWGCQCEEFCVPGPSRKGCQDCELVCAECEEPANGDNRVYSKARQFVWTNWFPRTASVFTRRKLMKKTITKTIPSYQWVVEDVCQGCQAQLSVVEIAPGADVPPPPVGQGEILYPASFALIP